MSNRSDRGETLKASRGARTHDRSRAVTWLRRYLHVRAIVAIIVVLGLLAAEVAAIISPAG